MFKNYILNNTFVKQITNKINLYHKVKVNLTWKKSKRFSKLKIFKFMNQIWKNYELFIYKNRELIRE